MKIAICGKMCSGKSHLAGLILKKNPDYKILSYGKKVKDIATEMFNMKTKDRSLIINVASKLREIDPDVWSNYVLNQANNLNNCIIDDLRFQNELDGLINDESEWIFIKLNISKKLQESRLKTLYPNNYKDHIKNSTHESEKNELDFKNCKVIHIDCDSIQDCNLLQIINDIL